MSEGDYLPVVAGGRRGSVIAGNMGGLGGIAEGGRQQSSDDGSQHGSQMSGGRRASIMMGGEDSAGVQKYILWTNPHQIIHPKLILVTYM